VPKWQQLHPMSGTASVPRMALFFLGFNRYFYPHNISLSILTKLYLLHSPFTKVFLKIPFEVLFFSFFTPLHSALISDSSVKHHHYDSQLFISFTVPVLSQKFVIYSRLITIDTVSTWMSANLLSLNQSKTAFLFIWSSQTAF